MIKAYVVSIGGRASGCEKRSGCRAGGLASAVLSLVALCLVLWLASSCGSPDSGPDQREKTRIWAQSDRFLLVANRYLLAIAYDGTTWREERIWELPGGESRIRTATLSYDGEWVAVRVATRDNGECEDAVYIVDPVNNGSYLLGLAGRTADTADIDWSNSRTVIVSGTRFVEGVSNTRGYAFRIASLEDTGTWMWDSDWAVGRYLATVGPEVYFTKYSRDGEGRPQIREFGPLWSLSTTDGAQQRNGILGIPIKGQFLTDLSANDGYILLGYERDESRYAALFCAWSGMLVRDSLPHDALYPMDTPFGPAYVVETEDLGGESSYYIRYWDYVDGERGESEASTGVPKWHFIIGFSNAEDGWWLVYDGKLLLWRPWEQEEPEPMYECETLAERYSAEQCRYAIEQLHQAPVATDISFAAAYREKPSVLTLFEQQPECTERDTGPSVTLETGQPR